MLPRVLLLGWILLLFDDLVGVMDLEPRSCGGEVEDDADMELAASAGVGLDILIVKGLLPPCNDAGGACCQGLLAFDKLEPLPPAIALDNEGACCSKRGAGKTGCAGRLPVPLGPP